MDYQAPLRDMCLVLHELFDVGAHCELLGNGIDRELIDGVLEEGARYTGQVVAPLNRNSDGEGAKLKDGVVTTPTGFRGAYRQYSENDWASMTGPTEYDGQGFPQTASACFYEMLMAASLSFRVYSGLTEGTALALYKHGDEALRRDYLGKLVSSEQAGTMCLTEPQAGTDLVLLRIRAEAQVDGSYAISGSKISISDGEQGLTENIVHLVLACLVDVPARVEGISLFLVPKFVANPDGSLGERNSLGCGAIEHKMGIKGASTCVMNFDGARGWLLGQVNQGLACMFTMMNDARFQVDLQGLGIAERAFQDALGYVRGRLQSRALAGPQAPDKVADPITVHPDVRRMLLIQRTLIEGCRMLATCCARQLDLEHGHPDADGRRAMTRHAALLILIVKAFLTDISQEVANLGAQVYGGHGFIREWGTGQLMRDSRITQIYEGVDGIQALDLVRRKLLGDQGGELLALQGELAAASKALQGRAVLAPLVEPVLQRLEEWRQLTDQVLEACARDPQEIGATSVDFLQYSAYVLFAVLWLQAAARAQEALDGGSGEGDFYRIKLRSADFYLRRILPRASIHRKALLGGADCLMVLLEEHFLF